MSSFGAIHPLISVSPNTDLAMDSACGGLVGNELQHIQISAALRIAQWCDSHVVARHGKQIRVYEMKIVVGYAFRKVVADPEIQVEPVEAIGGEFAQVGAPECFVVIPRLVFNLAYESP